MMTGNFVSYSPPGWDTLLSGAKTKPRAHRTPDVAAVEYNRGGLLVRNYNQPDVLKKALAKLDLAKEIYLENGWDREAANAAAFAAEAQFKLGRVTEARSLLEFARSRLTEDRDKPALDHCQWIEARLAEVTNKGGLQ